MLFSSLEFLFLFLPLSLILYILTPRRFRNGLLLAVSLLFYGWDRPAHVLIMAFTILVDFAAGRMIERRRGTPGARRVLIAAVAVNLGLLGFFKYAGFLAENLRHIPWLSFLPVPDVALPIGISFYTFQALSYVVDVYRGDVPAQKDAVAFGTYVTLFPQLIAGPIVRYRDVAAELKNRHAGLADVTDGARTFLCGLCKKVLLANAAGEIWTTLRDLPPGEQTTLGAWLGIALFSIQLYYDFSGYSDMAIGLGRVFGFRFPENFNYPFVARSVREFWQRWHITLSSWFREYVYIPLGGNRGGAWKTYRNLLIVWLLTGLWHGASWNFVLWGLYFFLFLAAERLFLGRLLAKAPRIVGHLYTLLVVAFSFFIFVFDGSQPELSASAALTYLGVMFGRGAGWTNGVLRYEVLRNLPLFAIFAIGVTPLPKKVYRWLRGESRLSDWADAVICPAALLLCTAYLLDSAYNPFLYFRF